MKTRGLPREVPSSKGFTTFQASVTAQESSVQTHEFIGGGGGGGTFPIQTTIDTLKAIPSLEDATPVI